jgi:hypothetical protein
MVNIRGVSSARYTYDIYATMKVHSAGSGGTHDAEAFVG